MTAKLHGGKNVSKKHCHSRPGRLLSNSRNAKPGPVCEPFYFETLAGNENPRVLTFSSHISSELRLSRLRNEDVQRHSV
ncbi:hypothetical protein HanPI659440_Chr12g0467801 [Helianthus annuus]|nr:hypothetical protein HanPI659440_Chr12g0467801 [Helianthus annuus]